MRTRHNFWQLIQGTAFLVAVLHVDLSCAADNDPDSFFESKVRPLLVERCFECHGEQKQAAGLRLDSREGWEKGGDTGPALVPGKPEQSLLIAAVAYDGDIKMPPPAKLLDTEIEILKHWVALGGEWPAKAAGAGETVHRDYSIITDGQRQHWSFQPLRASAPPDVRDANWVRRDIDRFILARLERAGLTPAPPADSRTWLRRVTYDLTGLPPTMEEVAALLADDTPAVREHIVERLLSSPQYGEHWARHWQDVARYADSSGKAENEACANAFRYRDYVVKSFNEDKPFDQFVREQIAGDLLPADSEAKRYEQLIATGFLQLGPKSTAEKDKTKLLLDVVDDQIDTVGKALLGLTVSCARCHDHKLEPIPQRDYYALSGIFASTRAFEALPGISLWYESPLANAQTREQFAAHQAQAKQNQEATNVAIASANEETVKRWRPGFSRYLLSAQKLRSSSPPSANAGQVEASIAEIASPEGLDAAVLLRWFNFLASSQAKDDPAWSLWHKLAAAPAGDFAAQAQPIVLEYVSKHSADATPSAARLVAEKFNAFSPASLEEVADRYAAVADDVDTAWYNAQHPPEGKPKLAVLENPVLEEFRQVLYSAGGLFGPPAAEKRGQYFPAEVIAKLAALEQEGKALIDSAPPPIPYAMTVVENDKIGDAAIAIRGDHLALGDAVPRGYLQVVSVPGAPPPSSTESGRRELSEWIASAQNPLTPRVIVNRIWHWHFGRGLSRTPDNLGLTGQAPTHPELLDTLASTFIARGWTFKQLHREICLSSTYAMGGAADAKTLQADPENLFYSRFPLRRLTAEEMRDSLLAVSGRLDLTLGGNLFNYANRTGHVTFYNGPVNYDFTRRSLYLPIVRNVMYDLFDLFDHGDALSTLGQRDRTTVATQALYWMNSALVMDAAAHLAQRVLSSGAATTEDRIATLYRFALQRSPEHDEVARMVALIARLNSTLPTNEADSAARERVVWQACCQSLLASNEFVTVD